MRAALVVVLGLGLAIGLPSVLRAQSSPSRGSFDIPQGPIACHERVMSTKDSAIFMFEMIDGTSADVSRRLVFSFDSAGAPRYGMVMAADLVEGDHQRMEVVTVRLAGNVAGHRMRAINGEIDMSGSTADSVPGLPRGASLLTPDELARATALAHWVWDRRCAANRGSPPSSPSTTSPTSTRS
jgi:hypothetical protein